MALRRCRRACPAAADGAAHGANPRHDRPRHPRRRVRQRGPAVRHAQRRGRHRPALRARLPRRQPRPRQRDRLRRGMFGPGVDARVQLSSIPTGIRTTGAATCTRCSRSPSRSPRRSSASRSAAARSGRSIGRSSSSSTTRICRASIRGSAARRCRCVDDAVGDRVARAGPAARRHQHDVSWRRAATGSSSRSISRWMRTPGTKWAYNSGGSQLLSGIIRHATGQLHRRLRPRAPVRAARHHATFTGRRRRPDIPTPKAGSISSPPDLARIGYLYLRDGVWDGRRVLPAGWVQQATTRHVTRRRVRLGLRLSVVDHVAERRGRMGRARIRRSAVARDPGARHRGGSVLLARLRRAGAQPHSSAHRGACRHALSSRLHLPPL